MAADRVLQRVGTQPLQTYLDRRKVTVADWVALRPNFKVCVSKTGYDEGWELWKLAL